ncbi:MAG: MoxR family ATPase [Kofleriaceae bacterium]|nr:MAG: MoxR family ATPase [Kofleriaceae bacterium]MBZ0235590.1 MoxR family ATPase [Kofleriaceae bacterium]
MKPYRATSELDTSPTEILGSPPAELDEPVTTVSAAVGSARLSEDEQRANDLRAVAEIAAAHAQIVAEIDKRIVGQRRVIEHLLTALFARGHCLFVGVPGLAKTLLISTLAETLNLTFQRIQFTPDLMPADITGTEVLEEDHATGRRSFRFLRGPVFANMVLADEINRTPPKTQAALLQSMQEYRVTAGGRTHELPLPFLVFATQNPIEQEGTYPLPEAQLDRFMFQVDVDYPSASEEEEIVRMSTSGYEARLERVLSPERVIELQELVRRVPAADHVVRYAVALARATRPQEAVAPPFVREYVQWGAGPRASQFLVLAGKARAILDGRFAVSIDDVAALARPTLQHRLILNYRAEAEGVRAGDLVDRLLGVVAP